MIFGIGTDIVKLTRVRRIHDKFGHRFLSKILSKVEIEELKESNLIQQLAGSFAAKEATVKALGTGFRDGIYPNQIRLHRDNFGKPFIRVVGRVRGLFEENQIFKIIVSISHEADFAVAFVLLEK